VFSQDESRILTWGWKTARLWDACTGRQIGPALQHQGPVWGAVFSRDESRILTWTDDKTARLWDVPARKQIDSVLQHRDIVRGAVFSRDESPILTWSEEAHDGPPDLGQEDRRDHLDRLEEGGTFRRQLSETTSRLSASG